MIFCIRSIKCVTCYATRYIYFFYEHAAVFLIKFGFKYKIVLRQYFIYRLQTTVEQREIKIQKVTRTSGLDFNRWPRIAHCTGIGTFYFITDGLRTGYPSLIKGIKRVHNSWIPILTNVSLLNFCTERTNYTSKYLTKIL